MMGLVVQQPPQHTTIEMNRTLNSVRECNGQFEYDVIDIVHFAG